MSYNPLEKYWGKNYVVRCSSEEDARKIFDFSQQITPNSSWFFDECLAYIKSGQDVGILTSSSDGRYSGISYFLELKHKKYEIIPASEILDSSTDDYSIF